MGKTKKLIKMLEKTLEHLDNNKIYKPGEIFNIMVKLNNKK